MPNTTKRFWMWPVATGDALVGWSLTLGQPQVTIDFHSPDGRPMQLRFDTDDARRVAVEMWRTANRTDTQTPARRAG